jgi:hypothetical protein
VVAGGVDATNEYLWIARAPLTPLASHGVSRYHFVICNFSILCEARPGAGEENEPIENRAHSDEDRIHGGCQ